MQKEFFQVLKTDVKEWQVLAFQHRQKTAMWSFFYLPASCQNKQSEITLINGFNLTMKNTTSLITELEEEMGSYVKSYEVWLHTMIIKIYKSVLTIKSSLRAITSLSKYVISVSYHESCYVNLCFFIKLLLKNWTKKITLKKMSVFFLFKHEAKTSVTYCTILYAYILTWGHQLSSYHCYLEHRPISTFP